MSFKLNPKTLSRFWSKVIKTGNCWEWTAHKNNHGYGRFQINYKNILAHRFSYQLFNGDIPQGMELDHICCNRKCVNPDHLEVVSHKENIRRGNTGKYQSIRTHCPQGHEYNEENTYLYKKNRRCRECHRIKSSNDRLKKINSIKLSKS